MGRERIDVMTSNTVGDLNGSNQSHLWVINGSARDVILGLDCVPPVGLRINSDTGECKLFLRSVLIPAGR